MSSKCSERGWAQESCSGLGVRVEVRVAGLQWPSVKPQLSQPLVGDWVARFGFLPTVGPFHSSATFFSLSVLTTPTRPERNLTALD